MGSGGFQQGPKGRAALAISGRDFYRGRDALALDHDGALRARFAAIRRIRLGDLPPLFARALPRSRLARLQSIRLVSPKRLSNSRWIRGQSPAWCHSLSLRQQVIPEPQPSSWGSISQGMPLRSTKRMPVKAWRLGTRGRPHRGRGASGGNNGSSTAHDASSKMGFAIGYYTTTSEVLLGTLDLRFHHNLLCPR